MSQQEILSGLSEIVTEIGGVPVEQVRPEAKFSDDLGIDSLSMVEIITAAEDRFGVRIPDGDLGQMESVGAAADYIAKAGVAT